MEYALFVITLILTILIAAIPSFTDVIIRNRGVRIKNITPFGWVTILLGILLFIIQLIQFKTTKENERERDVVNNVKLDALGLNRDKFLLKNNESLLNGYTKALEDYHLKYDANKKQVFVDSSKIYNNSIVKTPDFSISSIVLDSIINKSEYYISISLYSQEATTFGINIKLHVAECINGKYYKLNSPEYIYGRNGILSMGSTGTKQIILSETAVPIDHFAFHFQGTYFGEDKKIKIFDRIYAYNIRTKSFVTLTPPYDEKSMQFFSTWN